MPAMVGILHMNLSITGCRSLKEKRSRIQPILHRLHREYNLSVAEMEMQDKWNTSAIACAVISNDAVHCQQVLQNVVKYMSTHFANEEIVEFSIEII